jgi:hypothetical protein
VPVTKRDPLVISSGKPAPAYTSWPTRGDLATNPGVLPAVTQAWAHTSGVHQQVRILYASQQVSGSMDPMFAQPIVIVATARTADGRERIGWFTSPAHTFNSNTILTERADVPAPSPGAVYDLSIVYKRPLNGSTANDTDPWTALVLAAPGYNVLVATGPGEYPQVGLGHPEPEGEFVERSLSHQHTQVLVSDGHLVADQLIG